MDASVIKQKCKDIVRQAQSSRIKYSYNALIEIRKKHLKNHEDKGLYFLVEAGLVGRLAELIRTRDSLDEDYKTKVLDLTLSILANMCMHEMVRNQVLKTDCIQELGELFLATDTESQLNRCCRCLANILQSPKSWEAIHGLEILEKLAELLNKTTDDDCKQTFIRAVRLLGQTPKHVVSLLENGLVMPVLKHVDAENQDVAAVSLRCVLSLAKHGCTPNLALQVGKSGKVDYLMGLVEENNRDVLNLICQLSNHIDFRPYFGNAGGIIKFIEYLKSTELPYKEWRVETLNILCLCCQESVNRMKLRENDALAMFIEALSNPEFKILHERIVSALVCFQYDEQGFDILLNLGLVPLLCRLLREHMDKTINIQPEHTEEENKNGTNQATLREEEHVLEEAKSEDKVEVSNEDSEEDKLTNGSAGQDKAADDKIESIDDCHDPSHEAQGTISENLMENTEADDNVAHENPADDNVALENPADDNVAHEKPADDNVAHENPADEPIAENKKATRPKYSINSPTYEAVVQTLDESYHTGAKCIESFTPPYSQYSYPAHPYSPLSNSSYYSPSGSSPEYPENSPNTSSSSDRGRASVRSSRSWSQTSPHSPRAPIPKYTGFTWSPESSPERSTSPSAMKHLDLSARPTYSPESSDSATLPDTVSRCSETDPVFDNEEYQYSPVISSIDFNEGVLKTGGNIPSQEEESDKTSNEKCSEAIQKNASNDSLSDLVTKVEIRSNKDQCLKEKQNGSTVNHSNSSEKCSVNKSEVKPAKKIYRGRPLKRKRRRPSDKASIYEYNILVLLSRVQVLNASLYITPEPVLTCLLDYISRMESPQAKSARLLSRTFRDRHCFQDLMIMKVPLLVYNKLLREQEYSELVMQSKSTKRKSLRSRRSSGLSDCSMAEPDRFSVTDEVEDLDTEEQPTKRQKVSESVDNPLTNQVSIDGKTVDDICSREKCGIAFLEDFSSVADTAFGRGVLERVLLTCAQDQYIEICKMIPFIISSAESRKFFFLQLNVFDKLFDFLETKDLEDTQLVNMTTILKALSYLTVVSDVDTKYSNKYLYHSPYGNDRIKNGLGNSCKVNDEDLVATDATIVFIVEGENIVVNKSILMEKSEFVCAMLQGGYKESNLKEIPLPKTSKVAFRYLIHHLYGCGSKCEAISYLHKTEPNRISAKICMDLLVEADKHLLPNLKQEVIANLVGRFLVPECAYPVFEYAVMNETIDLQKAVVSSLLVHATSESLYDLCREFLTSIYKATFLQTIYEILSE